jgi:hypothetical protein
MTTKVLTLAKTGKTKTAEKLKRKTEKLNQAEVCRLVRSTHENDYPRHLYIIYKAAMHTHMLQKKISQSSTCFMRKFLTILKALFERINKDLVDVLERSMKRIKQIATNEKRHL